MSLHEVRSLQLTAKTRRIAYWATTGFAAIALGAADLLRVPAIMESLAHLGYPVYFATILGTWMLLGSAAIVAPGLPRVKEWAYAGHVLHVSPAPHCRTPHRATPSARFSCRSSLLGAVVASWALRPARRTLFAAGFAAPRAA